jgi:cell division protein ZapA (FtsZ GTPase activity inhibitor)
MKQRYTITIADMEVNVISDGSPEAVESLVGIVDRKMREILLANRRCSKSEAALLCALDYCSDKLDAMRKRKQLEGALDMKDAELRAAVKESDMLRKEIEKLSLELETMKESLRAAHEQQAEARIAAAEPAEAAPEAKKDTPAEEADAPEVVQLTIEEIPAENPTADAPEAEEPAEAPEAEREQIAPEDVEFDPTEIFRRAKANRGIRKSGKRKV